MNGMAVAENLCKVDDGNAAWEIIRSQSEAFLWTDDEDSAARWNQLFATRLGRVVLEGDGTTEEPLHFRFRERTVAVDVRSDRDDPLRQLHALAQALSPDCDLRLCRDSTHSSDVAFLPLLPEEWAHLSRTYGDRAVDARFLSVGPSYADFHATAFQPSQTPRGTSTPDMTDWDGGPSYRAGELQYTLVSDGPGQPRRDVLRKLVLQHLEPGPVTVSFWRTPETLTVERDQLVDTIAHRIARIQIRVANVKRTGFLVVEGNGVAAGWRTDGWRPTPTEPKKAWQFWKR